LSRQRGAGTAKSAARRERYSAAADLEKLMEGVGKQPLPAAEDLVTLATLAERRAEIDVAIERLASRCAARYLVVDLQWAQAIFEEKLESRKRLELTAQRLGLRPGEIVGIVSGGSSKVRAGRAAGFADNLGRRLLG
jgi:hypothetical protein